MYVWRQRTRRDRGQNLLDGVLAWGTPKDAELTQEDDDKLQHEGQTKHVNYFQQKVRVLMHEYLNTNDGKNEIACLMKEMEVYHRLGNPDHPTLSAVLDQKKAISEIYKKYDADGSNSINKDELQTLLKDLHVSLDERELNQLMKVLDAENGSEVTFEEFYKCEFIVRELRFCLY